MFPYNAQPAAPRKKRLLIGVLTVLLILSAAIAALFPTIVKSAAPNITLVMPKSSEKPKNELYPAYINEWTTADGQRVITKFYELRSDENPADISREPFKRGGVTFELGDITRSEQAGETEKEYRAETVTTESASNDAETVLKSLPAELEFNDISKGTASTATAYISDWSGILTLDYSTITVTEAGTTSSTFTKTITREYPNLSSNDTSLIPKTVNDADREYYLDGVTWQHTGGESVDGYSIGGGYTATAVYSRLATSVSVTGYIVTAEYKGEIMRTKAGKTVYTAYFYEIETSPTSSPEPQETPPQANAQGEENAQDERQEEPTPTPTPEPQESPPDPRPTPHTTPIVEQTTEPPTDQTGDSTSGQLQILVIGGDETTYSGGDEEAEAAESNGGAETEATESSDEPPIPSAAPATPTPAPTTSPAPSTESPSPVTPTPSGPVSGPTSPAAANSQSDPPKVSPSAGNLSTNNATGGNENPTDSGSERPPTVFPPWIDGAPEYLKHFPYVAVIVAAVVVFIVLRRSPWSLLRRKKNASKETEEED